MLKRGFLLICAIFSVLPLCQAQTSVPLQVARWWDSDSAHKAADVLKARLAQDGYDWHEVQLPASGAGTDLKSRALNGTAPDLAHLRGEQIVAWANLGLLTEFQSARPGAADAAKWDRNLLPAATDLAHAGNHLVALPMGVHRMNTMFYNRVIFAQYGLRPPSTWEQFTVAANRLAKEGIVPLAQSSDPQQIAALFENLLLSEGSPDLYRRAFIHHDSNAFADTHTTRALLRLRILKKYMQKPVPALSPVEVVKAVAKGDAAMAIMGDFAKGELNAAGFTTDTNFGCVAVPGTAAYHLYDVDTLVLIKNTSLPVGTADHIAQVLMSPTTQADFNAVNGSVSPLKNADPLKMDSCARSSWKLFAQGGRNQVPSVIAGMTGDIAYRNALVAELNRYFNDNSVPVNQAQSRLAALSRR